MNLHRHDTKRSKINTHSRVFNEPIEETHKAYLTDHRIDAFERGMKRLEREVEIESQHGEVRILMKDGKRV